jgi:hypothetical protein
VPLLGSDPKLIAPEIIYSGHPRKWDLLWDHCILSVSGRKMNPIKIDWPGLQARIMNIGNNGNLKNGIIPENWPGRANAKYFLENPEDFPPLLETLKCWDNSICMLLFPGTGWKFKDGLFILTLYVINNTLYLAYLPVAEKIRFNGYMFN